MYSEADLPITTDGRIYHLALKPEELAENIILVGDPDRVPFLAEEFLSSVETDVLHRGLRSITGVTREHGVRVSIITSGMGTPSLEIVLQEITALNEINFASRKRKSHWPKLKIIRVGTSGAIHRDTVLGTAIVSKYAVGLENTGLFYDIPCPDAVSSEIELAVSQAIQSAANSSQRFDGAIKPYAASSSGAVLSALQRAAEQLGLSHSIGITVSSSGFFANQGRDVARISPSVPDIDKALSEVQLTSSALRIENMEMEASFLFHFASGLGYEAGAICPVIANRVENTFADNYQEDVRNAARAALLAFTLT